jgi:ferredoxin
MTRVRFLTADGALDREVESAPGTNLLDLAQANGQPLEGSCEGSMACSTCHVVISDDDFGRLEEASVEEDDLLDLAAHVTRNSRLACQICVPEGEPFTVTIPPSAYNLDR